MTSATAKHHEIAVRYAWHSRQRKFGRGSPKLIARVRMREIERLFVHRYGGALPDDDAGLDDLDLAAHHIAHLDGDAEQHILAWASVWAPWLWRRHDINPAQFAARIASNLRRFKADTLAWRLRLTMADRTRLGITTIGAVDCNARMRTATRRTRDRIGATARRRAAGAVPREESAARKQPWLVMGMSRATWYRKGKPMPETNSSTADEVYSMGSTNSSQQSIPARGEEAIRVEDRSRSRAVAPVYRPEHPVPAIESHLAEEWLFKKLGRGDPIRGVSIAGTIGARRFDFLHRELIGGTLYLSAIRAASRSILEVAA